MEYYWIAQYNDGITLKQYENEKENSFKDIDQNKLKFMFLVPLEPRPDAFAFNQEVELKIEDNPELQIEKVEAIIYNPHGKIVFEKQLAEKKENFFIIHSKFIDVGEHIIKWGIRTKDRIVEQKNVFVVVHEKPIVLHFDPSYMRLILVRRNYVRGNERWLTWLFGWQGTIKGKNVASILYIQPNGKIDLSENFDLSL